MLQVQVFTFNAFSENTYLLYNAEKQCWIVDPGMYDAYETKELKDFIIANGLIPQGIINTHAHLDHIFGVQALVDAYKIPFGMHEKEMPVLNNAKGSAMMFGFSFDTVPQPTHFIKEGVDLLLGKDVLEVRFTPGHSPGSISFYNKDQNWVIGGDVLFAGGIGRTDLPGGNYDTLLTSIRNELFTLPDNTTVFSGHGPSTSIGIEKTENPFLN